MTNKLHWSLSKPNLLSDLRTNNDRRIPVYYKHISSTCVYGIEICSVCTGFNMITNIFCIEMSLNVRFIQKSSVFNLPFGQDSLYQWLESCLYWFYLMLRLCYLIFLNFQTSNGIKKKIILKYWIVAFFNLIQNCFSKLR